MYSSWSRFDHFSIKYPEESSNSFEILSFLCQFILSSMPHKTLYDRLANMKARMLMINILYTLQIVATVTPAASVLMLAVWGHQTPAFRTRCSPVAAAARNHRVLCCRCAASTNHLMNTTSPAIRPIGYVDRSGSDNLVGPRPVRRCTDIKLDTVLDSASRLEVA